MSDSYHISNLGSFGGGIPTDMDGYVHLTAEGWMEAPMDWAGNKLEGDDLVEWAEERADEAVRLTDEANAAVEEWRANN